MFTEALPQSSPTPTQLKERRQELPQKHLSLFTEC